MFVLIAAKVWTVVEKFMMMWFAPNVRNTFSEVFDFREKALIQIESGLLFFHILFQRKEKEYGK
jgi:hypothetical protein